MVHLCFKLRATNSSFESQNKVISIKQETKSLSNDATKSFMKIENSKVISKIEDSLLSQSFDLKISFSNIKKYAFNT